MQKKNGNVIAIIPARYASSRFPGKPLAEICGKPMIQHVVERASQADILSRVIVATDDERIAECVASFGGEWVMTRKDHLSGSDRLAEAAERCGLSDDDVVVNVQGDQPLCSPEVIEQVAQPILDDPQLPMATLIYRIRDDSEIADPNHVKVVFDHNGYALYFSRSPVPFWRDKKEQDQAAYYRHLGLYAYKKSFLLRFVTLAEGEWERREKLEQLRVLEYGYKIKVVLTDYDSTEVDTPEDAQKVARILCPDS